MAEKLTFRDFVAAVMQGDEARARGVLASLLALDDDAAAAAATHFRTQMADDADFLPKAMSMRGAVEGRDSAGLASLLEACFGLSTGAAAAATRALFDGA